MSDPTIPQGGDQPLERPLVDPAVLASFAGQAADPSAFLPRPDAAPQEPSGAVADDGGTPGAQAPAASAGPQPVETPPPGTEVGTPSFEVDGRQLTAEQARAALALAEGMAKSPDDVALLQYIASRPGELAQYLAWSQGQRAGIPGQPNMGPSGAPAPVSPQTPDAAADPFAGIDTSIYPPEFQALFDTARQMRGFMAGAEATRHAERQRQMVADLDAGRTWARDNFGLNDDELATLDGFAAQLNVLPGLLQQLPGAHAIARSLEIAYRTHPEFIAREHNRLMAQSQLDAARARKAGAVAGGGGNSPRQQPEPQTTEERDQAFRAGVRAAVGKG